MNTIDDVNIIDELKDIKTVEKVGGVEGAIEPRTRNTRIIDLVEGDILVDGETYQRVSWGEISVSADGTIDTTNGELVPVSVEAFALGFTGTIFNMEDVR